MGSKETDMEKVKAIAHTFLYFDLKKTKSSPIVVQHPFFNNGIVGLKDRQTGELRVVNILEDLNGWAQVRSEMRKQIDRAETVLDIGMLLTNPYRLVFMKYAEPYLSAADMGRYINSFWCTIEYISTDKDMSKTAIVRLLKKCDRQTIMNDREHAVYESLPDEVAVYRGITEYNRKHDRSLCWTTNIKIARYFANRFNQGGYVYRANIKKADILAYFDGRSEQEVVVDYRRLTNMVMIEKLRPSGEVERVEAEHIEVVE